MGLLSQRFITREIEAIGSTVTIRNRTVSNTSNWGDQNYTESDTENVKCMVNTLTRDDELVKEGVFKEGDKVFFFGSSVSNITRGNQIQHDSTWYQITKVIKQETGDNSYVLVASVEKI